MANPLQCEGVFDFCAERTAPAVPVKATTACRVETEHARAARTSGLSAHRPLAGDTQLVSCIF